MPLLNTDEVAAHYGVQPADVERLVALGKMPAPIEPRPGEFFWTLATIDEFERGSDGLNISQVASLIGCQPATVNKLAAMGRIPLPKEDRDGDLMWDRGEIEKFVREDGGETAWRIQRDRLFT